MKKYRILSLVVVFILFSSTAGAITYEMSWTGDLGYSMLGSFSFDENTAGDNISEFDFDYDPNTTNDLQNMTVSFYNPSDDLLGTYSNVVSGNSYPFLYFSFDVVNEEIDMPFLAGGDAGADDWLLVSEEDEPDSGNYTLNLLFAPYDDPDSTDSGGTISVSRAIPEPATMLLLGTGLIGIAGFGRKKFKK